MDDETYIDATVTLFSMDAHKLIEVRFWSHCYSARMLSPG